MENFTKRELYYKVSIDGRFMPCNFNSASSARATYKSFFNKEYDTVIYKIESEKKFTIVKEA